jgi:putative ABC transport system ATP-binding protein
MAAAIELEGIHKVYQTGEVEVRALRGVSLAIGLGEFVAVMGASGSGKSTLMNLIGCLDRPTSGRYRLAGDDVSGLSRDQLSDIRSRRLGFVFQNFNLLPRATAVENVELPLLYSRDSLPSRERRRRAEEALGVVGLANRMGHFPSQLSGGQQQRVAIARALVSKPSVVLADEPTGNLDTRTGVEIMGLFQALNEQGITLIMVTHELDIASYCRRMVVMRDGQIVADRPVEQRLSAVEEMKKLEAAEQAASLREAKAERHQEVDTTSR